MTKKITKRELKAQLEKILADSYETDLKSATPDKAYRALAQMTRAMLSDGRKNFLSRTYAENGKQVYYLCMEFLLGRSLKNNLYNLGIASVAESVLADYGLSIEAVFDQEPDAGLGNGGLGRLAACYMDGMATTELPGMGYSILYEYGIFRQELDDGWQNEHPDNWLPGGGVWLHRHPEAAVDIKFDGEIEEIWEDGYHRVLHKNYTLVRAIPSDMYVSGYDSDGVSRLRLWEAKDPGFDLNAFNKGDFSRALNQNASLELISKILYPNDNHFEGKVLRLRQQYFLSAASIADIIGRHLDQYGTLDNLPDKVAIHINDTHPTLVIPELMRILLDECGYNWENAFSICRRTFAYTNHTVMSEALEKWDEGMFRRTLPRIHAILQEMDRRAREEFYEVFPGDDGKVNYMALLQEGQVRMANICCYVCHSVNGVSKLHSDIIKQTVFHDYFLYAPEKFTNVTNGIAYRRWLLQSNAGLTGLLEDTIGGGFKKDAAQLQKFAKYADDASVLQRLDAVKRQNKQLFVDRIAKKTGEVLDPDSIFNCQVKRLHEYKRQQMNALNILCTYLELKNNPQMTIQPCTYIFAAKAAPGYYMAKQIIHFIYKLGQLINADERIRQMMRVVYLEDYNVTISEQLMPASEISQQISLAGTEASGTGNMKFMLNGAITLGTYDGANIEIAEAAGADNFVQFGMLAQEVDELKKIGYNPTTFIAGDELLCEALNFMEHGWDGKDFRELAQNLRQKDPYMVMADFRAYREAEQKTFDLYGERPCWNRMSLYNIAGSGVFSADRAVLDYANDIWYAKPIK